METIGFKTQVKTEANPMLKNEEVKPFNGVKFPDYMQTDNMYLNGLIKAFFEFVEEERKGYVFTELRLTEKIKATRLIFPEDKEKLRDLAPFKF